MKNQTTISVILFLIVSGLSQLNAQIFKTGSYSLGMNIDTYVTGGGHGTFYSGNILLYNNDNVFSIGPCIQKRTAKPGGFKISYTRILVDNSGDEGHASYKEGGVGSLQLNLFTSIQYVNKLPLSYAKARVEELTAIDTESNFSQAKLSTINLSLGIEFNVKLSDKLQLKNFAGASIYYHTNYSEGMYMEKMLPALIIGTGINIF